MGLRDRMQNNRVVDSLLSFVSHLSPKMGIVYICAIPLAIGLAIASGIFLRDILQTQNLATEAGTSYQACQDAVNQLQDASDFLTTEARQYCSTGNVAHLEGYLNEVEVYDRRGSALKTLRARATSEDAAAALGKARTYSDELAELELYAMRLEAEASHLQDMPKALAAVELDEQDASLSDDEKHQLAVELVQGTDYAQQKMAIREQVNNCSVLLVNKLRAQISDYNDRLNRLIAAMHVSVMLLLGVIIAVIVATCLFLLWPMVRFEDSIRGDEPLKPQGAYELHKVIDAYNDMYARSHERAAALNHEANHDPMTGALNRGAFEDLLTLHKADSALILIDVDNFKAFNDSYGHDMGDAILVELVGTLYAYFRPMDHICRIGGDEFAIIMTAMDPSLRDVVASKFDKVADFLRDTTNGLPAATISIGVAFGRPGISDSKLFQEADEALYEAKRRGRDNYVFVGEFEKTKGFKARTKPGN